MSRYMKLEVFRARFEVVDPLEAAAQEPTKYWDAFCEGDDLPDEGDSVDE